MCLGAKTQDVMRSDKIDGSDETRYELVDFEDRDSCNIARYPQQSEGWAFNVPCVLL